MVHLEQLEDWDDEGEITHLLTSDLMFDQWATLASGSLEVIASRMANEALEALRPIGRKPRAELVTGINQIVPTIIANLLVLHRARPQGSRLIIQMEHRKKTRYDRSGFRKLPDVVQVLESMGHIVKHDAVFKQKRTAIEAAGELKAELLAPEVLTSSVCRAEGEETIILTARPTTLWVRGIRQPKTLVDYTDTEETFTFRREMDEINQFLSSHSITLEGEPTPAFRLVRQFTLRSPKDPHDFEFHGRLYGGFWMNLKATKRHRIRMNGEPVADLDFASMFPRLAYGEVGEVAPEGDLYAVPGLENHREGAKAGLSALLSYRSSMKSLPARLKKLLPDGWTASHLRQAISDHHPLLVPYFEKDFGLDLMFIESRILLVAMKKLLELGVPALPMHDGMMVPSSKAHAGQFAMQEASEEITNSQMPVIRK